MRQRALFALDAPLEPCPMCKGTGEVVTSDSDGEAVWSTECWRCDGASVVGDYDPETAAIPF